MRIEIASVIAMLLGTGCSCLPFTDCGCGQPGNADISTHEFSDYCTFETLEFDAGDSGDTGDTDEFAETGDTASPSECEAACRALAECLGDVFPDEVLSCELEADAVTCSVSQMEQACVGGRRPPGLRPLLARAPLHRMAWMEAASVHAFVRLHRELQAHGAPDDLANRCLLAARDEVRHAHVVARMAGVPVPRPVVTPLPLRDLDALALDNAVEGCVHETWAAVDAHLRAARGRHRAAWTRIAADETRHAQLAWDIDAWLATRGAARPDARRHAAVRLVRSMPPARRAMAERLREALWA